MPRTIIAAMSLSAVFTGFACPHIRGDTQASIAQSDTTQASWQKEFEEICSKTEEAMSFAPEELERFVQRCDALRPKVEKLVGTPRKVYLERLRMCRGLYAYVLESKKSKEN